MRYCLLLLVLAPYATPAPAATHHIPEDFATIQGCIDEAEHGDECVVGPGRYNEVIDFVGKAITVRSTDPKDASIVEATIIDGAGLNNSVVKCVSGEGPDTVLSGLTITGGTGTTTRIGSRLTVGGGMRNGGSSPSVSHCDFQFNTADFGGGMANSGASPMITDCTFGSNKANIRGGGVSNSGGFVTISGCRFIRNEVGLGGRGGGMFNSYTQIGPIVSESVFDGNVAFEGGGMYNDGVQGFSLIRCVFTSNSAKHRGGGLFDHSGNSTIEDCHFRRNLSRVEGGGIFIFRSYAQVLWHCTFLGNVAVSGGGVFVWRAVPTLSHCTFTDNTVSKFGGGLVVHRARPVISNCRFVRNSATTGGGIVSSRSTNLIVNNCTFATNAALEGGAIAGLSSLGTHAVAMTNCVLHDGRNEIWLDDVSSMTVGHSSVLGGIPVGVIDGGGNVDIDPMFARVPDDGGDGWGDDPETPDVDESVNDDFGDLRLRAGSPLIDAGDNGAVPFGVVTDLGGLARFVDDPFVADTGIGAPPVVDMGAHEYQPDCNANGVGDDVDIADGTSEDCNANGYPDECDGDTDSDGVPNECDTCADSVVSETIVIGTCDTDVANASLGEGCTMADAIDGCPEASGHHGSRHGRESRVSCIKRLAHDWRRIGLITGHERHAIVDCAKSNSRLQREVGLLRAP